MTQKGDLPSFTAVLFGDGSEQPRERVGLFTAFTKIFTQKSKSLVLITSELKISDISHKHPPTILSYNVSWYFMREQNLVSQTEGRGCLKTRCPGRYLTLRRLMSYIYGAPILDVSRSHTTTQHSR